jgi:hypothetical protein
MIGIEMSWEEVGKLGETMEEEQVIEIGETMAPEGVTDMEERMEWPETMAAEGTITTMTEETMNVDEKGMMEFRVTMAAEDSMATEDAMNTDERKEMDETRDSEEMTTAEEKMDPEEVANPEEEMIFAEATSLEEVVKQDAVTTGNLNLDGTGGEMCRMASMLSLMPSHMDQIP